MIGHMVIDLIGLPFDGMAVRPGRPAPRLRSARPDSRPRSLRATSCHHRSSGCLRPAPNVATQDSSTKLRC